MTRTQALKPCQCYRCREERDRATNPDFMDRETMLWPFCECGNKRCPHAADHCLACTNSNEVGQKGSLYE